MVLSLPYRFTDGAGFPPAAANWNDDYDWLTALASGFAFIANGGMELWAAGTTFTNPANATVLADSWTEVKSGTSSCTADVTREGTTIDTGTYSMKVNITGAGSSDSIWAIKQSVSSFGGFAGLSVVAGVKVKLATANKVRIKVYDGTTTTYSSYHTGDGTWQLLQAKAAMSNTPSEITVTVEINPANFTDAIYIDSAYLYAVPSSISTRAQQSLVFSPLAAVGNYLLLSGGTLTGNLTFSPSTKGIVGTATNDSPAAGNVGESLVNTAEVAAGSSGQYKNFATVTLTAGDWDVEIHGQLETNSATLSGDTFVAISVNTNNTTTDHVIGLNQIEIGKSAGATNDLGFAIPRYILKVTGSTPVYGKMAITYSGGSPFMNGTISARRMR